MLLAALCFRFDVGRVPLPPHVLGSGLIILNWVLFGPITIPAKGWAARELGLCMGHLVASGRLFVHRRPQSAVDPEGVAGQHIPEIILVVPEDIGFCSGPGPPGGGPGRVQTANFLLEIQGSGPVLAGIRGFMKAQVDHRFPSGLYPTQNSDYRPLSTKEIP
jgi:hypothetical protein